MRFGLALMAFAGWALAGCDAPPPIVDADLSPASLVDRGGAAAPKRLFYIGHSLQSNIPDMVSELLVAGTGDRPMWKEQHILGSPLRWQWDEPTREKKTEFEPTYQVAYDKGLREGKIDALILTDSVPRGGKELEDESVDYLTRFAKFAKEANPDITIYYYETWHCNESGTEKGCAYDTASPTRTLKWRERLDADRAMWERIVDKAAEASGARILIIPAGQGMARLADAIERGEVPGFKTARDLFTDDIHVTPYANYFIACLHYAALTGRSPVGLAYDIKDRWGRGYWTVPDWTGKLWPAPDPAAVRKMQEIAWETVAGHPRTGVPKPGA